MTYESEAKAIQKRYGDLDQIRVRLGLSQRQFCKLLLVDPSAWNRWIKNESGPPPHVWRSIGWYLLIHEKDPWLSSFFRENGQFSGVEKKLQEERHRRDYETAAIRKEIRELQEMRTIGLQDRKKLENENSRLREELRLSYRHTQRWAMVFLTLAAVLAVVILFM